jgi:23S rRNA (cytidine1920-2'-O)/16S rRNA (cytidine1409-2'-O)-methyltransferase
MTQSTSDAYVSRGGDKLAAALDHFEVDVSGHICADLGSHVGGFVECLLRRGAARVYAIDTAYGILAWKLRRDARVVVFERTNAMHVSLPEPVEIVTIDVGWTPQVRILPNVMTLLSTPGATHTGASGSCPTTDVEPAPDWKSSRTRRVVTLVKPHYEVGLTPRPNRGETEEPSAEPTPRVIDGVLPDAAVDKVVTRVLQEVANMGWIVHETFPSPIRGHAGNREIFALLAPPV